MSLKLELSFHLHGSASDGLLDRVASFVKRVNSVFPEIIKTIRGEVSVLLSLTKKN